MASTPESFQTTRRRNAEARHERDRALSLIAGMCENGQRGRVIPFLLANMQRTPSLRQIRLWQLDSVIFRTSRARALKTIRRMRETIGDGSTIKDGYATVGWALADRDSSVRMSTWLYLLLLREGLAKFDIPDGFPYGVLYDDAKEE